MKLPTFAPEPGPELEAPAFTGLAAIHLLTPDLDRSVRFYGGLLALPLVRTEPAPRRYFFSAGEALLVLEAVAQPAGGPGAIAQIAWSVPDDEALEALRRRLLGSGVPVSGLENHGFAHAFRFRDPVTGVFLQAFAKAKPFTEEDRRLDPEPTPTAAELLRPRPG